MRRNFTLPFSAIVGHDDLKAAYLANIVNPSIGGLLISGPKGSGKSSIVHSAIAILPQYEAAENCSFNCSREQKHLCSVCSENENINYVKRDVRIVTLPISTTEDRLIGSIDIEAMLSQGKKVVRPGILAEANNNILYIDEVNLLPDHLVDDILDSAASHMNRIEREGMSVMHPAKFILVGTMNPEEGELRPQILDRFPLAVFVKTIHDVEQRAEIVKRNLLFESNSENIYSAFSEEDNKLTALINQAKQRLNKVKVSAGMIHAISSACSELKVDGQRPDIVITKTAMTLCSMDAADTVNSDHVMKSARLALVHRTRDGGLIEPPSIEEIDRVFTGHLNSGKTDSGDFLTLSGSINTETGKKKD